MLVNEWAKTTGTIGSYMDIAQKFRMYALDLL